MKSHSLPPLIAVVGCDGSGKSTVTEELQSWLSEFQPTVICHLGKQSGNMGRTLEGWPLIGKKLRKAVEVKTTKAKAEKGPDLITAIGIYAFVLRRSKRFRRMIRLRRAGNMILTDRFPQVERAIAIDGLQLEKARKTGMIGWLGRSERQRFDAMVTQLPDLMLRLNVSLDVAFARKPDHRYESLKRKITNLSLLNYQGAPIVEIDADAPLEEVLTKAKDAIAQMLNSKYGMSIPTSNRPQ